MSYNDTLIRAVGRQVISVVRSIPIPEGVTEPEHLRHLITGIAFVAIEMAKMAGTSLETFQDAVKNEWEKIPPHKEN